MNAATILSLLVSSLFWLGDIVYVKASDVATSTNLDANARTASFECSHHGKEWRICTWPDGWGSYFYCPAYSEFNETELETVTLNFKPAPLTPCFTCPGADSNCSAVVSKVLTANNITEVQNNTWINWNIWDEAQTYCESLCESNMEGESCSMDSNDCTPGASFCDSASDDAEYTNGTCAPCPDNRDECLEEGFTSSRKGTRNCLQCRLGCFDVGASKVWVDGEAISSEPIRDAIQSSHQSASGPLHNCSDSWLDPENICLEAEGKMCLVDFGEDWMEWYWNGTDQDFSYEWQVSNQAKKSGCVGVIAFNKDDWPGSHRDRNLLIPFVYIPSEEGRKLVKDKIGASAKVEVDMFGADCYPGGSECSASVPCYEGYYCEYIWGFDDETGLYTEGYCNSCPSNDDGEVADPLGCFFNVESGYGDDIQLFKTQKVQSCTERCDAKTTIYGSKNIHGSKIIYGSKFGTSEVNFNFDINTSEEDRCIFCPNNDIIYPNRTATLFGSYQCWQFDEFFDYVPVHKESSVCQLAHDINYICGCDGSGYGGANTRTKRVVLAWLPRVSAILSILGSSFIIFDTLRKPSRRVKFLNQLLSTISLFDIVGAVAYALTTRATPKNLYLYGADGDENTCIAQGFFIQIGAIACYLSVSLSVYYLLTIKHGWNEDKLKEKHAAYYLYIPPIVFGLVFASVGIQFYQNVLLWCGYIAIWWPVPIIISIAATTMIMISVCLYVYEVEKRALQYTYNGGRTRLSMLVFKQACLLVSAFYITWGPYLMLQYLWISGKGYNNYGLVLTGATLVPLQGFLNCIVYCRPRYFHGEYASMSTCLSRSITCITNLFNRRRRSQNSTPPELESSPQPTPDLRPHHSNDSVGVGEAGVADAGGVTQ